MVFTDHNKRFMPEIYFKNGRKIDREWDYSIRDACDDFREEFPDVVAHYDMFSRTLQRIVDNYRETGSIARKSAAGRPRVWNEENIETVGVVIEDQPHLLIRHLQQQNYLTNSLGGRVNLKDMEEVWDIIEKHKEQETKSSSTNIAEANGDSIQETGNKNSENVSNGKSNEEEPEKQKKKRKRNEVFTNDDSISEKVQKIDDSTQLNNKIITDSAVHFSKGTTKRSSENILNEENNQETPNKNKNERKTVEEPAARENTVDETVAHIIDNETELNTEQTNQEKPNKKKKKRKQDKPSASEINIPGEKVLKTVDTTESNNETGTDSSGHSFQEIMKETIENINGEQNNQEIPDKKKKKRKLDKAFRKEIDSPEVQVLKTDNAVELKNENITSEQNIQNTPNKKKNKKSVGEETSVKEISVPEIELQNIYNETKLNGQQTNQEEPDKKKKKRKQAETSADHDEIATDSIAHCSLGTTNKNSENIINEQNNQETSHNKKKKRKTIEGSSTKEISVLNAEDKVELNTEQTNQEKLNKKKKKQKQNEAISNELDIPEVKALRSADGTKLNHETLTSSSSHSSLEITKKIDEQSSQKTPNKRKNKQKSVEEASANEVSVPETEVTNIGDKTEINNESVGEEVVKFNVKGTIISILERKGTISLKKLEKKVLLAHQKQNGEFSDPGNLVEQIHKKLKRLPVQIRDDQVCLVVE